MLHYPKRSDSYHKGRGAKYIDVHKGIFLKQTRIRNWNYSTQSKKGGGQFSD